MGIAWPCWCIVSIIWKKLSKPAAACGKTSA